MRKLELFEKKHNLELVATSSVWNIHSAGHLSDIAKKKGTNLNNEFRAQGLSGGFTLVVGKIGRSAHSETEIGIFKGVVGGYYAEVFINNSNAK